MTYTASVSDDWPIERIEYTQHLLGEGLSARQIGVRLGVSHRAVLAKLSRLGISCGTQDLTWPQERLARLRELAKTGMNCRQIGAELGMTRNAILGKMHREGIPRLPKSQSTKSRAGRQRPQPHKILLYDGWKKPKNPHREARAAGGVRVAPQARDLPVTSPGLPGGILIWGLGPEHCRYACEGTGVDIVYCGAATVTGSSWCERHFHMVFKPRER